MSDFPRARIVFARERRESVGNPSPVEIVATPAGIASGRIVEAAAGVVGGIHPTYAVDPSTGRLLVRVPVQANLNSRNEIITDRQQLLAQGEE